MSSLIKEFDDLVLKLDAYDLSEFSILLNNCMALDIFQYAKSKDITRGKNGFLVFPNSKLSSKFTSFGC